MATVSTHKLGTTRAGEGTRIWLEGKRLLDHGFTHGVLFERVTGEGRMILMATTRKHWDELPRTERGTVAGTSARPIIDIVGQAVRAAFPAGNVTATWSQGRIVITGE